MIDEAQQRSFAALLAGYPLQQEVQDQVLSFLYSHPTAFPLERAATVSSYTYNDGRVEHRVVQLQGSVAISYKGQKYKLPAIIILPHGFPREVPLVYMNPKPGMVRNERSPCVDASLRVRSGYLDKWEYPFSSLERLYADLKEAFGKNPPLRQRLPKDGGAGTHGTNSSPTSHDHRTGRGRPTTGHEPDDGDGDLREALIMSLHQAVNETLDMEYGCLASAAQREEEAGIEWDARLRALGEEVAGTEARISELVSSNAALAEWLQQAEAKLETCRVRTGRGFGFGFGRSSNRGGLDVTDIDAYEAAAPMAGPMREALEAEACLRAVQDAVRELDEAFAVGRVTWSQYKRMLSQLMAIKFQARVVQRQTASLPDTISDGGARESLDCAEWTYPDVEDVFEDEPHGVPNENTEERLQELLGENPLHRRRRFKDLVSSSLVFRSMP